MKVKAHLLAFGGGKIREIHIPEDELKELILERSVKGGDFALGAWLDLAFKYGQNDFQPLPCPSVAAGDVIELPDGSLHRVDPAGFTRIESL